MRSGLALVAGLALLGSACGTSQPTVRSETLTEGRETRNLDIREVAVAPFRTSDAYPRTGARNVKGPEAAALIERYITEALQRRGIRVVPAGDVRTALGLSDPKQALPPPGIVTKVANQEFGVPAVVFGTVKRMRERANEAMGANKAASVWYEVTLVRAPGARPLWKTSFNETQRPLNENVFNASRYPGGGMRWLTAEELAKWGAAEVAREFPAAIPY